MINELCQWIENKTDFQIGVDLFINFRPQGAPDICTVVLERGGKPDYYVKTFAERAVQVLTRDLDYASARDRALVIFSLMHGQSGVTLPVLITGEEYVIDTIDAMNVPQSVGQDKKGRFEISTNYVVRVRK